MKAENARVANLERGGLHGLLDRRVGAIHHL
jgi:hypothetical protein